MTVLGLVIWPLAPSVIPGIVLLLALLVGVPAWAALRKNRPRS